MIEIEKKLLDQLFLMKEEYQIKGIKAEFEAEGTSYQDMVRLRRLTLQAGVKLFVKIGGVEAVRDLKDCLELGVDGIIAPMVESPFGIKKFLDAYGSVFPAKDHHLAINIETKQAVQLLSDILAVAYPAIDAITIGRTDLSASYFDPDITPDSHFIWETIEAIIETAADRFAITVGGNISNTTQERMPQYPLAARTVQYVETRKVIIPTEIFLANRAALLDALWFEELFILSRKEVSERFLAPDLKRLDKLARRSSPSPVSTPNA
ncbi:MAG: hypothetical protein LDL24_06375 [Treponema sp.]|nr:hypothetical protein [Treponema sp.]